MQKQNIVEKALSKALHKARQQSKFQLDPGDKYIIFSDHHRGGRTLADDFLVCEDTYLKALSHYHQAGFILVVLGDVEELWEEDIRTVLASYPLVFEAEAGFFRAGKYHRIYGNHDQFWYVEGNLRAHLGNLFLDIRAFEGLVLEFQKNGEIEGEIFLVHGNQGIFDVGAISNFARILTLLFWRTYQKLTGKGRTTPAKDACLRGLHDTRMYNWAKTQKKLILITGHTHRPVWSSLTHLEQLRNELISLQGLAPRPTNYDQELARLVTEIQKISEEHPPCNDTVKTNPCYFNTGCCSFKDGDITGIELDSGFIRLVKWEKEDGSRQLLQEARLSDVFSLL